MCSQRRAGSTHKEQFLSQSQDHAAQPKGDREIQNRRGPNSLPLESMYELLRKVERLLFAGHQVVSRRWTSRMKNYPALQGWLVGLPSTSCH